jgi:hypothetical protein
LRSAPQFFLFFEKSFAERMVGSFWQILLILKKHSEQTMQPSQIEKVGNRNKIFKIGLTEKGKLL